MKMPKFKKPKWPKKVNLKPKSGWRRWYKKWNVEIISFMEIVGTFIVGLGTCPTNWIWLTIGILLSTAAIIMACKSKRFDFFYEGKDGWLCIKFCYAVAMVFVPLLIVGTLNNQITYAGVSLIATTLSIVVIMDYMHD